MLSAIHSKDSNGTEIWNNELRTNTHYSYNIQLENNSNFAIIGDDYLSKMHSAGILGRNVAQVGSVGICQSCESNKRKKPFYIVHHEIVIGYLSG